MSTRQPARNDRSEVDTIVRPPPVHLRRWTARPHGVEFFSQLGAAALRALRRAAMRLLGEAAYAGDEEEVERCRSYVAAIEAEVESRREQEVAVRAAAAQYSKDALAGSRATDVHGAEPRGPRVGSAG